MIGVYENRYGLKNQLVYDYHRDIEPKLCEYMGIDRKDFRNYHSIIGGGYKDFWHIFLDLFEVLGNDTYFSMHHFEDIEVYTLMIINSYGEWGLLLLHALLLLMEEYIPDGEDSLRIWISW